MNVQNIDRIVILINNKNVTRNRNVNVVTMFMLNHNVKIQWNKIVILMEKIVHLFH